MLSEPGFQAQTGCIRTPLGEHISEAGLSQLNGTTTT